MTAVVRRRKRLNKTLQRQVVKWMPLGVRLAVRSLGDRAVQPADLEDLVQDAHLQMCLSARTFDGRKTFQTHVGTGAALAMKTSYKARVRRGFSGLVAVPNVAQLMAKMPAEAAFEDVGPWVTAGRDPADEVAAAHDRAAREAAVWAAVDRLPRRQRMVMKYRHRAGLSFDEIGGRLGVSRQTAANDEAAAIHALRGVLRAPALDA